MDQNLAEAIRLRSAGDKEGSRAILLRLVEASPRDPALLYQCAWTHDSLGREKEAVGFYERSIKAGLSGEDLAGAYLGLGSTLRGLGAYAGAVATLEKGVKAFPEDKVLPVFLAMALYNSGRSKEAVSRLLHILVKSSADPQIVKYQKALCFYAEDLDRIWPE